MRNSRSASSTMSSNWSRVWVESSAPTSFSAKMYLVAGCKEILSVEKLICIKACSPFCFRFFLLLILKPRWTLSLQARFFFHLRTTIRWGCELQLGQPVTLYSVQTMFRSVNFITSWTRLIKNTKNRVFCYQFTIVQSFNDTLIKVWRWIKCCILICWWYELFVT